MLYGYTVCTLQDDGYTLSTAFHKGNAFFRGLKHAGVTRIRKKDGEESFRYLYIPQLLYVRAQNFKQLDCLKNGLIIDEVAPKKKLLCVLQQLDTGKFAPYTLKHHKRYTKAFINASLYEPLDATCMQLQSWFYTAPLNEHDEPLFQNTFSHVTKQPFSALTNYTLMQQLLKLEDDEVTELTDYILDLRKYAHHASYIVQKDIEVATGCEIIVNASSFSTALLVNHDLFAQIVQTEQLLHVNVNATTQQQIEEACVYGTGPFANKIVVIGNVEKLQAWLHVQQAVPLRLDLPLQLSIVQHESTVKVQHKSLNAYTRPRRFGIVDPFAHTPLQSVQPHEIACNNDVAYIDSLFKKQAIERMQGVRSRFAIEDNVVLLHPQAYMPHMAQLLTYDASFHDALEPLLQKQPPIRKSFHYDTLQAVTNEVAPIAQIVSTRPKTETPFYEMLAQANIHLNREQQQAVEAVHGPVMILAGAGSGKTTTLISRIAYMVEQHHIAPQQMLLVTFTKKAAHEMKERLLRLPNGHTYSGITVGTYHAICLRILREQGRQFQLLASEAAKHFRFKMILKKLGLADDYTPEAVMSIISNWKNRMLRPVDIKKEAERATKETEKRELFTLHQIYALYEKDKEARNELDFDDFLLEVYYLLLYDDDARALYQQRFQYVLCDEFQDVSTIQYELTRLFAAPNDNLCICGDDNQTIYSWRAASSSFMLDFKQRYPHAQQIKLETNYRSTADIVGFSNYIIAHNKKQIKKVLNVPSTRRQPVYVEIVRTPEEEAALVLDEIQQLHYNGMPYRKMVILTRAATYTRTLFEHLVLHEIPAIDYSKQGESFYDHDYIKRFIAAMNISLNPNDANAIGLIGKLLYMQQETWINTIQQQQYIVSDTALFERVMLQMAEQKTQKFQRDAIIRQMNAILRYRHMSPKDVLADLRTGTINCEKQLELDASRTKTLHKEEIRELFDEFNVSLSRFKTIEAFLQFYTRLQQKKEEMERLKNDPTIDAIPIMTIHSAKGLEFDVVFAIGWFEDMLPHFKALGNEQVLLADDFLTTEESLEEERRLAYVCATRAKERLYISSVRFYHDKPKKVSRFLFEGAIQSKK